MSFKLSVALCQSVVDADERFAPMMWGDVRLGLEQVQDAPGFQDACEVRWAAENPAAIEAGPAEAIDKFIGVSSRMAYLTHEDAALAVKTVIDTEEFKASCEARWAFMASQPHVEVSLSGFDE